MNKSDWKYDSKTDEIYTTIGGYRYDIDLERIEYDAGKQQSVEQIYVSCTFWVFHMLSKRWCTEKCMYDLATIFRDIFAIYKKKDRKTRIEFYAGE